MLLNTLPAPPLFLLIIDAKLPPPLSAPSRLTMEAKFVRLVAMPLPSTEDMEAWVPPTPPIEPWSIACRAAILAFHRSAVA